MLSVDVLQLRDELHRVLLGLELTAEDLELEVQTTFILLRIGHGDVAELESLVHILVLESIDGCKAGYLSEELLLLGAVAILEERS